MLRIIILLAFLVSASPVLATSPSVLVLHSYHPGLSWTDTLNSGIHETFRNEMPQALLWVEYLDTKRNTDTSYLSLQAALLKHKLADSVFTSIIVTDNDALNFVLAFRNDIFRSAPVIFCGVNDFRPEHLQGQKGITGLAENPSFAATMGVTLSMHPDTREFVIVGSDQSLTDQLTDHALHSMEKDFPTVHFTYLSNLPAQELRSRLALLGPGQIIFVHGVMRNEEGVLVDYRAKNQFLSTHASVPIFGFWDFEMGTGCVGGKMIQGQSEGARVARLAMQVMNGASPDSIPVDLATPSRFIFDYTQLQRFEIDPKALPPDSLILNEPVRFYQIEKRYIWTATAGVAALLATLALLMSSIRRRQEAQDVLRRHKEELEEAVRTRTEHLRAANDELEREMHERIRAEGDLRKARARLEIEVDRRTGDLRFEIEQRRLAETHIRDREAKARALINAPTETLLLMDQAGIILDINETGASRLGKNRESLTGLSVYAVLDESLAVKLQQTVDEVFATGEAKSIAEYGEGSDFELHLYPVYDEQIRVTRVAVFIADVTGPRRMARQILLLDKINSLGRMAAGIAHEIRNPLTGIHGYLYAMDDICAELPDSEPIPMLRSIIEKIRNAAGKMESVIRRVLDFSKPGMPRLETLDPMLPVQEALGLMTPTLRTAGIVVETNLAHVPSIRADRMQLEQAVVNIVDNASRAMRQSQGNKRIEIALFACEDRICLTVADTGPGIPPADRERIFDPFYTTAPDGTGIGLSIVQRIIADHHGTIQVGESALGGAEFRLEFPVPAREHP